MASFSCPSLADVSQGLCDGSNWSVNTNCHTIRSIEFSWSLWSCSAIFSPLGMLGGAQGVHPIFASSLLCPLCQDQAVPLACARSLSSSGGLEDTSSYLRAGKGGMLWVCSLQSVGPGLFLLYLWERLSRHEGTKGRKCSRTAGRLGHRRGT